MKDFIELLEIYKDQIKNYAKFLESYKLFCNFRGNAKAKNDICNKILTWLYLKKNQRINSLPKHIIINGTPGCGKTTFAKIIGGLISSLGILKGSIDEYDEAASSKSFTDRCVNKIIKCRAEIQKLDFYVETSEVQRMLKIARVPKFKPIYRKSAVFNKVTRRQLVGEYIGQTAVKTGKVIESSLGGVLFIDEAYNLCNRPESPDGFDMECLTELIEAMTEHSDNLIIILAGYKDMIERTILKVQPGLERRICLTIDLDDYSIKELYQIFTDQVNNLTGWEVENCEELFKKEDFPFYGGDTERLAGSVQDVCCLRFARDPSSPHKVLPIDIQEALAKKVQKPKLEINHMYL